MKAKVVFLGRIKSDNGSYPFVEIQIKNGRPIAPENVTTYYLRYSTNGMRKVEPVGQDLMAAFTAFQNCELNYTRIARGLKPIEQEASALIQDFKTQGTGITIRDAVAVYLEKQKSRIEKWRAGERGGLSKSSVVTIDKAMRDFQAACDDFGASRIDEFRDATRGRAILLHFKKWLRENTQRRNGLPAATDEKKFVYVGEFLASQRVKMAKDKKVRWDDDPGLLEWDEVPKSEKKTVSAIVYYTPADLLAMWRAAEAVSGRSEFQTEDLRDLLAILTLTGMRDEEVQHMEFEDIDRNDGIKVGNKLKKWDWKPKNGERIVEIIDCFADALRERLRQRSERLGTETGLVFPNQQGNPDQNLADRINCLQDLAEAGKGQPDDKPYKFSRREARTRVVHNFRRTFATILSNCYQLSAQTVQHRIGDRDIETTSRYLGMVKHPLQMKEDFEKLPFGDGVKAKSEAA